MWKTYCAAVLLSFTLALTACTAAVPALPYDTVRAAAVEYGCRGMLITPQSGDNALRLAERAVGDAVDNAQDWCLFLPYGPQDSPDKPEFGVIAVDDDADAEAIIGHLKERGAEVDKRKGFVVYELGGGKKIIHRLCGNLWTVD